MEGPASGAHQVVPQAPVGLLQPKAAVAAGGGRLGGRVALRLCERHLVLVALVPGPGRVADGDGLLVLGARVGAAAAASLSPDSIASSTLRR